MERISDDSRVLYIKLGEKGDWEYECILDRNILKIGYNEIPTAFLNSGNWDEVRKEYIRQGRKENIASRFVSELQNFYEDDGTIIWITFSKKKLWWARTYGKVEYERLDKTSEKSPKKIRHVQGKWSDCDIHGDVLLMETLSGMLTTTQGFRGTICEVKARDYAIKRINGEMLPEARDADIAYNDLINKIKSLLSHINWKDFELLVDLIFRDAGYLRISELGKTQKMWDFTVKSPVTDELSLVQVKSTSTIAEFQKHLEEYTNMKGNYAHCFYVVHNPIKSKEEFEEIDEYQLIDLIFANEIAKLVVDSGLTYWLLSKVS
jgi:hypothetical protein